MRQTRTYWSLRTRIGELPGPDEVGRGRGSGVTGLTGRLSDPGSRSAPRSRDDSAGARVLVMDGNGPERSSMAIMLETCGHEAVTVADGEACVEAYRQGASAGAAFSLVILDLIVPGGRDGIWTIRQLRAIDPGVRVILASSNEGRVGEVGDDGRCLGFRGRLQKPFGMDQLRAAVRRALAG